MATSRLAKSSLTAKSSPKPLRLASSSRWPASSRDGRLERRDGRNPQPNAKASSGWLGDAPCFGAFPRQARVGASDRKRAMDQRSAIEKPSQGKSSPAALENAAPKKAPVFSGLFRRNPPGRLSGHLLQPLVALLAPSAKFKAIGSRPFSSPDPPARKNAASSKNTVGFSRLAAKGALVKI